MKLLFLLPITKHGFYWWALSWLQIDFPIWVCFLHILKSSNESTNNSELLASSLPPLNCTFLGVYLKFAVLFGTQLANKKRCLHDFENGIVVNEDWAYFEVLGIWAIQMSAESDL